VSWVRTQFTIDTFTLASPLHGWLSTASMTVPLCTAGSVAANGAKSFRLETPLALVNS
jgi:hypothetical protein